MPSVAIINPNNIHYSELDKTHHRLSYDKLKEDIEDEIEIFQVNDARDGMEKIVEICKFDPDELIHTTMIYETENSIYYLIHTIDDKNEHENVNKIGIYLTKEQFRITGSVGIYKEELELDEAKVGNISNIDEIIKIYHQCFIHKACIINTKGEINEIKYIHNPIDWKRPDEANNIKFLEYEIFDKIMMVFIKLKPDKNELNEKASIIYRGRIVDDVIFALRRKPEDVKQVEFIYESITKELINKILMILSVEQDELQNNKESKIYNFYTIVEQRYKTFVRKYGNKYNKQYLEKYKNMKILNEVAHEYVQKQV